MARLSKTDRAGVKRCNVAVKIDGALAAKAKVIAAVGGITITDLVSEMLRSPLEARYQEAVKKLSRVGA